VTEYVETHVPPGDTKNDILETLAGGQPWVFIVAGGEGTDLDLKVETGGGIRDTVLLRALLEKTLAAMP
jgi:hypothetical protein